MTEEIREKQTHREKEVAGRERRGGERGRETETERDRDRNREIDRDRER